MIIKVFLTFVEKCDESTLMKLIQDHEDLGKEMVVVSDGSAAYRGLSAAGYKYSVVIHEHKLRAVKSTHPTLTSRYGCTSRDGLTKCTACERETM